MENTIPVNTCTRLLAVCLATGAMASCSHTESRARTAAAAQSDSWDPKAAAAYLDQREATWMAWPTAARDRGTFCVSCHTAVPYALSRPALRSALGESGVSFNERKLLDNVTKRVQLWNQVEPFYSGEKYDSLKRTESRGTEAVLNALILASYDAQNAQLSETTRVAFRNMWELQLTTGTASGAWTWLQFGMEPFEAKDSQYYGAALAAVAVGTAPESYRAAPEIEENLRRLREYLTREYSTQSTMNHVALLWASAKLPGLLDADRKKTLVQEIMDEQQPDGGWKLPPLAWPKDSILRSFVRTRWRADGTRQDVRSDGYATAIIVFALQQAGMPAQDYRLQHGISWLERNQNKGDGSWPSESLTKRRSPSSNVGQFMNDAATSYAALALCEAQGGH